MNNRIGQIAGRVWRALGEKGAATVAQIAKSINEPAEVVTLAVGWLARENKVVFNESKSKAVTVSLTADERKVFENTRANGAAVAR
jgi:hypothetical protein